MATDRRATKWRLRQSAENDPSKRHQTGKNEKINIRNIKNHYKNNKNEDKKMMEIHDKNNN